MPLEDSEEQLPLNYYKVFADCYLCYKYLPLVNIITNGTIQVIYSAEHALEPELVLRGQRIMSVVS